MKNYLVKSLFKVESADWHVMDRSHEVNMYEKYQTMHKISLESCYRKLVQPWQLIYVEGTVDDINQAFVRTFYEIYDLWHSEPCNILYTDPDTVVINPFDPWTEFKRFQMFNYTDPKSFNAPNSYSKSFVHFFNAGVRYFPATMSQETWQIGIDMIKDWDYNDYNTEQIVLNEMMWSQGIELVDVLRPDVAYQAQWLPRVSLKVQDTWNGYQLVDSKIVHVHGSRDSAIKLKLMQELVKLNEKNILH
jgi:hypothetical protein